MPKLEIPILSRPDIKGLVDQVKFTQPQMRQLGDYADDLMDRRVDSDTPRDAFGRARPPLSESYRRRKMREGRRGVRDMRRTGKTLAAMNVIRTGQENGDPFSIVGFENSQAFRKALYNQDISPWFGLDDPDPDVIGPEEQKVLDRAEDIFEFNVRKVNNFR